MTDVRCDIRSQDKGLTSSTERLVLPKVDTRCRFDSDGQILRLLVHGQLGDMAYEDLIVDDYPAPLEGEATNKTNR